LKDIQGTNALSLPRSFPIKAFQYLNRHANEFFFGESRVGGFKAWVIFILSILAGFAIFWSGNTLLIFFGYSQHFGDWSFGVGIGHRLGQQFLFFRMI